MKKGLKEKIIADLIKVICSYPEAERNEILGVFKEVCDRAPRGLTLADLPDDVKKLPPEFQYCYQKRVEDAKRIFAAFDLKPRLASGESLASAGVQIAKCFVEPLGYVVVQEAAAKAE